MRETLTARIRAELARGPFTAQQLSNRLGAPIRSVRSLVTQLMTNGGGVLLYDDERPKRYVSAQWRNEQLRNPRRRLQPEKPRRNDFGFGEDIRVAQRITVPQYRYGSSRLG